MICNRVRALETRERRWWNGRDGSLERPTSRQRFDRPGSGFLLGKMLADEAAATSG
jgi:hypothetical protein